MKVELESIVKEKLECFVESTCDNSHEHFEKLKKDVNQRIEKLWIKTHKNLNYSQIQDLSTHGFSPLYFFYILENEFDLDEKDKPSNQEYFESFIETGEF